MSPLFQPNSSPRETRSSLRPPPSMEYIIVEIKDDLLADTEVLINRVKNGRTGRLLSLGGPGKILVSVDRPGAQEQKVEVKNTTPWAPMTVVVPCN